MTTPMTRPVHRHGLVPDRLLDVDAAGCRRSGSSYWSATDARLWLLLNVAVEQYLRGRQQHR